ncbi:MAG TPA: hypothetical protein VIF15_08295 [Polyangiaceae bacterium]
MRSRSLLLAVLVGTALASSLATSVARADPVADAKDLFTRGRELRAQGDCTNAAGFFRKAYELYPAALGSLRNLAECEESLGHFASARRAWVDLKRALLTSADTKYEGWAQDAETAAARLAPKLATLTIDVNVVRPGGEAAPAAGVQVSLDGEKLQPSLVGTPLDRDPGRHVVRVTGARVQAEQQQTVDLTAGDAKRIALRVVVSAPEKGSAEETPGPGAVPPSIPPEDEQDRGRAAKRTAAWIGIGVGGAALVGAGISLGIRQSALDQVNASCASHQGCDPALQDATSRGQTASTLVTVLGIVGVVGLTSGIVLLATSSGHGQQTTSLVVTPTLGGASATWRF